MPRLKGDSSACSATGGSAEASAGFWFTRYTELLRHHRCTRHRLLSHGPRTTWDTPTHAPVCNTT